MFGGAGDLNSIPLHSTARLVIKPGLPLFVVSHFLCWSVMTSKCVLLVLNCKKKMSGKESRVSFSSFVSYSSGGFQSKCGAAMLSFECAPLFLHSHTKCIPPEPPPNAMNHTC